MSLALFAGLWLAFGVPTGWALWRSGGRALAVGVVPFVDADGITVVLDATNLAGLYKQNAKLVRKFRCDFGGGSGPASFEVEAAEFEEVGGEERLRVTLAASPGDLIGFTDVALVPRFFLLETGLIEGALPLGAGAKISFDATTRDAQGLPDPTQSYASVNGAFAEQASELNQPGSPEWDFFRFRVDFSLDLSDVSAGSGIDPRVSLKFLRLPFEF